MSSIRIASYNIEWMNNLFEPNKPKIRLTKGKALGRNPENPRAVAEKIAAVINDLKADIVGIQEGPAKVAQMKHFVSEFLDNKYDVFGVESGTQSIYAIVRKDIAIDVVQIDQEHRLYALLGRPVTFQPWGEVDSKKTYRMARPPVLLQLSKPGSTDIVELIVAHTKSQFTSGFNTKAFKERDPVAMKAAVLSRQKLSADIAAYRRHVTHVILSEQASGVILVGDLNDGFARNTFEKEFLMQSLVDELRGSFRRQNALLEHAFSQAQLADSATFTVQFNSPEAGGKVTKELIDHILSTPKIHDRKIWLKLKNSSAKIGHEVSAAHTDNAGKKADERPSDHIPVWADFDIK